MSSHRLTLFAAAAVAICAATAQAQSGIVLSATSHNFVSVPEGTEAKYGVHVTNSSGAPFQFSLSLTGDSNFTKNTDCPATLAPGAGCEIGFVYKAPAESKWENATFTIATNGAAFPNGNTGNLKAHAVPSGVITLNSQKHNFLEVPLGSTATYPFGLIIANGSSTAVPFSYQTTGDTAAYTVQNNCPVNLAAGGQCSLIFIFKPTAKSWQEMHVSLSTGSVPVQGGGTVVLVGKGA